MQPLEESSILRSKFSTGWMMWGVREMRSVCFTVGIEVSVPTTAVRRRGLESAALVSNYRGAEFITQSSLCFS